MAVTSVLSGAVMGVDGYAVTIETDLSPGLPGFEIVGLPGSSVKEARERVRSAIKNSGFAFPAKRVTVNLAPADTRKDGAAFDLPIAVGVLAGIGAVKPDALSGFFFAGELSLEGGLRPVNGVLPMVAGAVKHGVSNFVVPEGNAEEAAIVPGARVFPAQNIKEIADRFGGRAQASAYARAPVKEDAKAPDMVDFADVKGQGAVKRALESAAAGGHNLLMIGPPGSGKTMMARRVPTILPGLNFDESVEVTKIYSVAGLVKEKGALISARPFRSPHHTISYAALTGGGHVPKPGEISLSHKGVLFLDELPEFPKSVLEMLRQPMEDGRVTVSRVGGTFDYPTEFMLIASMNPCPCGYYPDTERCACSGRDVARYLSRLSGPLLDRIDIQIEAPRVRYEELGHGGGEESSSGIKARVARAREIQLARQGRLNAQLSARQTETFCRLSPKGGKLLKSAFEVMGLSARAYHKIIKTARTLADLDGETDIMPEHVSEAVGYRSLDRRYWR